jgi:hypothetical protein
MRNSSYQRSWSLVFRTLTARSLPDSPTAENEARIASAIRPWNSTAEGEKSMRQSQWSRKSSTITTKPQRCIDFPFQDECHLKIEFSLEARDYSILFERRSRLTQLTSPPPKLNLSTVPVRARKLSLTVTGQQSVENIHNLKWWWSGCTQSWESLLELNPYRYVSRHSPKWDESSRSRSSELSWACSHTKFAAIECIIWVSLPRVISGNRFASHFWEEFTELMRYSPHSWLVSIFLWEQIILFNPFNSSLVVYETV